jgi:hypothetical protein
MNEKFDPAPFDKYADLSKDNLAKGKEPKDKLQEGLEETFPASDPPSTTQPSKTLNDTAE